jgi:acetyl-CoA carboxylase biotin carboxyl carrier protein
MIKEKSLSPKKSNEVNKVKEIKSGVLNRDLLRSFTEFMREEGLASFKFKSKEFEVELNFANSQPGALPLQQSLAQVSSAPVPVVTPFAQTAERSEASQAFTPPPTATRVPLAAAENTRIIKSPFVGTFYRAPGPGKNPFVEVGSVVKAGDALCVLEAMKLMNEIEAEFKCKILKILVDDASPAEYGEALFEVEVL